ncbi:MAG: hypothetical protein EH225_11190 [Calditrichaeota bacterium]|nr:hypothetical protein [Calditrichota bacterium]RQV92555.1 MAG: hypothetical protein EH221_11185 [bacterium]RQV99629.1 MAG: hypothetical protein EH225_11190 [Calditrichota bacterium]
MNSGIRISVIFLLLVRIMLLSAGESGDPGAELDSNYSEIQKTQNIKCGFPEMLQAHTPGNQKKLNRLLENRLDAIDFDRVYISPAGFFRIYYDTEGINAIPIYDRDLNGIPDYLEFVGKSFDRAWILEIDSLGFKPPPDSTGNPRVQYPVFCRRLGFYGQTWLEYEIPALPGINYVTFIEINTNFEDISYPGITDPIVRDSMAIAVTAAHEFNHALQSGYRLWGENDFFYDLWFIESSATYMEEVVAGEVNDYLQYLDYYLGNTLLPLDESTGGYEDYGKVVLEIMLGDLYGRDITRRIWAESVERRAFPALEKILIESGTDIESEFQRLALWLNFTGRRTIPGRYFPDAKWFPSVNRKMAESFQDFETVLLVDSLPRLSFQWYYAAVNTGVPQHLLLSARNSAPARNLSSTFVNPVDNSFLRYSAAIPFELPFLTENSVVSLGVVNTFDEGSSFFSFDLRSRPLINQENENVVVFPQPLKITVSDPYLKFKNLPRDAEIHIYSGNGFLLKSLRSESSQIAWDLRNSQGDLLGSGVYLFRVVSKVKETSGKFIIIQ